MRRFRFNFCPLSLFKACQFSLSAVVRPRDSKNLYHFVFLTFGLFQSIFSLVKKETFTNTKRFQPRKKKNKLTQILNKALNNNKGKNPVNLIKPLWAL